MNVVWLFPPSRFTGEYPMVGNNRWSKYVKIRTNAIYPIIAATGCTMLQDAGHQVDFIDCPNMGLSWEDINPKIEQADLIIIESQTFIINWIWKVIEMIRPITKAKIALYGPHVIQYPFESLERGADHIIACGDYDYGAFLLAKTLGGAPHIFKAPLVEELDNLPFVDRELVPWEPYFETWRHREEFGWYQSGRGCWCDCTFCSWVHTFYSKTMRMFSPERIFKEVSYANEAYGIREFLDDADTFMPKWGDRFAELLLKAKVNIYWNCQTRADLISSCSLDSWKKMKKSGLHIVKLGVDGGNDYTLNRIKKGYDVQAVEAAMKRLKQANLEVHINMIIGWPWETKKQAYDVIKWVKKLKPNQAQFSLIEPFPGTPIYEEAVNNGWFVNDPRDWEKFDMKSPILQGKMNAKEIAKLHKDAWRMFYLSPGFICEQLGKSTKFAIKERNLDSFRHLWRGYKGVTRGHMKAVE